MERRYENRADKRIELVGYELTIKEVDEKDDCLYGDRGNHLFGFEKYFSTSVHKIQVSFYLFPLFYFATYTFITSAFCLLMSPQDT